MDVDRPEERAPDDVIRNELQWSHVLMDVDSIRRHRMTTNKNLASMEPRPDGRG